MILLFPVSFGGNKVRFAEKYVENMQSEGYDSMVIYGNYHSNLCRILASLCNELSMPCYMIHNTEDIRESKETGNSRIIRRMNGYRFRMQWEKAPMSQRWIFKS